MRQVSFRVPYARLLYILCYAKSNNLIASETFRINLLRNGPANQSCVPENIRVYYYTAVV